MESIPLPFPMTGRGSPLAHQAGAEGDELGGEILSQRS